MIRDIVNVLFSASGIHIGVGDTYQGHHIVQTSYKRCVSESTSEVGIDQVRWR
jgi:hypothetical protein